jgi:hypothetical protein
VQALGDVNDQSQMRMPVWGSSTMTSTNGESLSGSKPFLSVVRSVSPAILAVAAIQTSL